MATEAEAVEVEVEVEVEASEPAGVISAAAVSAEWAVLTAASRFVRRQWGGRSRPFAQPGNFTHEVSPG